MMILLAKKGKGENKFQEDEKKEKDDDDIS